MIGRLKGVVDNIYNDHILLDVNGIGYIVYCSATLINSLSKDSALSLFIESQIKENSIVLFGFLRELEQTCFKFLTSVPGVGGKVAISILNQVSINDLIASIKNKDSKILQGVSGIGPKLANRIVTELSSSKQLKLLVSELNLEEHLEKQQDRSDVIADAVSVLVNLGFNKSLVLSVISNLPKANDVESIIKEALTKLSKY